ERDTQPAIASRWSCEIDYVGGGVNAGFRCFARDPQHETELVIDVRDSSGKDDGRSTSERFDLPDQRAARDPNRSAAGEAQDLAVPNQVRLRDRGLRPEREQRKQDCQPNLPEAGSGRAAFHTSDRGSPITCLV